MDISLLLLTIFIPLIGVNIIIISKQIDEIKAKIELIEINIVMIKKQLNTLKK